MKRRKCWIDIHNRDSFEDYMEKCITSARYDDNPAPILKDVLRTYREYKYSEKIIKRIEKKGVKGNG